MAAAVAAGAAEDASAGMATKICQHFLSGKCTRGEKCRFSHAAPPAAASAAATAAKPAERVCQHFLQGKCTRGEKCRFSHAAPPPSSGAPDARPKVKAKKSKAICTHYLNGECTRGSMCRFVHGARDDPDSGSGSGSDSGSGSKRATSSSSSSSSSSDGSQQPDKKRRKRAGLQYRQKRKDWLRYGAKLDNVMSIVPAAVGCTHTEAPLCRGHNAQCAKRKVDKPSAKRYGDEYWVCHKVVTGQAADSCGHFQWCVHKSKGAESASGGAARKTFDD
jgi:hypothetical protein